VKLNEERQKAETTIRELAEARKTSKLSVTRQDRADPIQIPNSELISRIHAKKPVDSKINVRTTCLSSRDIGPK
jgi:hypothetical protein